MQLPNYAYADNYGIAVDISNILKALLKHTITHLLIACNSSWCHVCMVLERGQDVHPM